MDGLPARIPGLELPDPLEGHNASTRYNAALGYHSLLAARTERIQLEIGPREPTLAPPERAPVHTLLRHWTGDGALIGTFPARCLTYAEAMAEKLRAALSRRQVDAQLRPVLRPRDFELFDVDRAFGIVRRVAERLGQPPAGSPVV